MAENDENEFKEGTKENENSTENSTEFLMQKNSLELF